MNNQLYSFYLILMTCLAFSCSGSKSTTTSAPTTNNETVEARTDAKGLADIWALEVLDTPAGTVKTDMLIEKVGDDYKAYMVNGDDRLEIEDFTVENNTISGEYYSTKYAMTVDFRMNYDAAKDTLEGTMLNAFEVKGTRKK